MLSFVKIWDNKLETRNRPSNSRRILTISMIKIKKGSFKMRLLIVFVSISQDMQSMMMGVRNQQTRFLASSVMFLPVIGLLLEGILSL